MLLHEPGNGSQRSLRMRGYHFSDKFLDDQHDSTPLPLCLAIAVPRLLVEPTLPRLIPEDGPAATALSEEVQCLVPRVERYPDQTQFGQGLAARASPGPALTPFPERLPKQQGRTVLASVLPGPELGHPQPADVLRGLNMEVAAGLYHWVWRGIAADCDGPQLARHSGLRMNRTH